MPPANNDNFILDSSVYIWPSKFAVPKPRPFNPRVFNDPFVFRFSRFPGIDVPGVGRTSGPTTAREILRSFVRHLESDTEPYSHQSSELEQFCADTDLHFLGTSNDGAVNEPVALLDDRIRDTSGQERAGNQRGCNWEQLSAKSLHKELLKPRYNMPGEHDADRRLIYVVNLDKWVTLALASTASERQTYFLKDFIYKHLGYEAALRAQVPHRGPPSFGLEFHFPFYALRQHHSPYKDHRKRANGCPLRRSRRITYLDNNSSPLRHGFLRGCVYEASVSCLVSGTNNYSWIAYLFVDTYHGGPENQESIKSYHSEFPPPDQTNTIRADPLTLGKQNSNRPIWTAREYFLRVFDSRIEQVKAESRNLVLHLLNATESFAPDYFQSDAEQPSQDLNTHNKNSQNLLNDIVRLMQQVNQSLLRIVNSWDRFDQGDRGYFRGLEKVGDECDGKDYHLLIQIKNHFQDIDQLRRQLESRMQRFERLAIEIDVNLKLEDKRTAETVKLLTVVQSIFQPLAAVAALYAVPSFLPFIPTQQNFSAILACLMVILLITSAYLCEWVWLRNSASSLASLFAGKQKARILPI